jgi:hypothetical protein
MNREFKSVTPERFFAREFLDLLGRSRSMGGYGDSVSGGSNSLPPKDRRKAAQEIGKHENPATRK